MNKLIKFFPFLPAQKDTGKLILALLFYAIGVPLVSFIASLSLSITIIVPIVLGVVGPIYSIAGIVFAIMTFTGHDFSAEAAVEAPAEAVEEAAEEVEAAVEE